jgi:glycosyltransferase involved in cell wall biosynthesis
VATRVIEPDLVSVVIPCYNQAHFLGDAIDSALGQTYPRIEIVVVDDGSPDDVATVATAYPAVRLIRTRNQGLSAARNNGLAASTGSLVVFLDADDRLLPDAVTDGVATLRAQPDCAMVFGRHVRVAPDGSHVDESPAAPPGDPYEALLRGNIVGSPAASLWRREAVEALGGFDISVSPAADYDLCLQIAQRFPIAQHNGLVAEVRRHDAGMHRDFALMLHACLTVLRKQKSFASTTPAYRAAYREGLANWRLTYGVRLARRTAGRLRSPTTFASGLTDLAVLSRLYPGVVLHAARRTPAALSRRRRLLTDADELR